jgi:hypothetical protein
MRALAIAILILIGGSCGEDGPDRPRLPLFVDIGGPKGSAQARSLRPS